ncbi:hypothetical protein [Streptacidiphilus jiangxiensis]|uniref:Uncharacterized protein n=1 Tax=Streptacidiphilus jiangxiensis TaxID=235985 RepID=A0A1H8A7V8_STRJI|nr:hypothetical protein [Streptacidiphilus jiangxiensis]SEM65627.1 hypothetical protein SAMN05414137_1417 [Streptacidiphilus jiangxiensis]
MTETTTDPSRPTAGSALREVADELRQWAEHLPAARPGAELPDLPTLSRHVLSLDLLFSRMVSFSWFRAGQGESDPQHLDLTADYGKAVDQLTGAQSHLARAYGVSASLLAPALRPGPTSDVRHATLTTRGNLALAQARSTAIRTADAITSHAASLDRSYQGQPLLTHEERRATRSTALASVATARPSTVNSRTGARR